VSLLKRGITGFNVPRDTVFYTRKDIAAFFQHIPYPYSRRTAVREPGPANNYFVAEIVNVVTETSIHILIHECFPLATAAVFPEDQLQPYFPEMPREIGLCLSENGIQVLGPEELNAKIPDAEWNLLGPEEREQTLYWSSETYGEVIFNTYD